MKKKIVMLLTCICVGTAMFAGCGSKADSSTSTSTSSSSSSSSASSTASTSVEDDGLPVIDDTAESLPMSDYITLGEYKGLKLTKSVTEVTDADVESAITDAITNTAITEGPAENGDTVYIAYVGKVDGEAFDGGTSEGSQLTLGSGQFIPGFEDGVVGMKVGETKDLNLTFPDPYATNTDLSGKDVVFSVTLNSITRSFPELTEDWVTTYTQYANIDEYRTSIRTNLENDAETSAESTLKSDAWQAVTDNCTVLQYQQSKIDSAKTSIENNISYYAQMAGTDLAGYKDQMGYTDEQYDAMLLAYAKQNAKAYMAIDAIAEKEGFTEEDQEYKDELAKTMEQYTMTEAELYEQYGEDTVKDFITQTRVMNLIIDSADVTVETVSADTESSSASSASGSSASSASSSTSSSSAK